MGQLSLRGLGTLIVQRVVHCHGHLFGHMWKEVQLGVTVRGFLQAPESARAQPSLRCGEWNSAESPHPQLTHAGCDFRKARLIFDPWNHQGLLRLPDPPAWRFVYRQFTAGRQLAGLWGFQDVQPHGMALRIIEQQPHVFEVDHAMQPIGEIAKQLGEVAVDGDCLRNLQQSLVLLCQSLTGRYRTPIHRCAKYARLLRGAQGAEREFLPLRRASRIRSSPFMRSAGRCTRSEEHTSELQSQSNLVCRLLLEKKKVIYRSDQNRERLNSRLSQTPYGDLNLRQEISAPDHDAGPHVTPHDASQQCVQSSGRAVN